MSEEMRDTRKDRETAREVLTRKVSARDPLFATIDPSYLRADAENRLRWIDCAPDGARHCVAPLQDKQGIPMGGTWSENVGPSKALREARLARGLHPLVGFVAPERDA